MANLGKISLFGNGRQCFNPIHVKDLANGCVDAIETSCPEVCLGGPEIFTLNRVAEIAFEVLNKPANIVHIPSYLKKPFIRKTGLFNYFKGLLPVNSSANSIVHDCSALAYGTESLRLFFEKEAKTLEKVQKQISLSVFP